jgi:hypothetical protein
MEEKELEILKKNTFESLFIPAISTAVKCYTKIQIT